MANRWYWCGCSMDNGQYRHNRQIDKMLKREKHRLAGEIKVLLLGTGESGKSTVMKQMKIIHGQSLLDGENSVAEFKHIIYQNLLKGIKVLIFARNQFAIPWQWEASEQSATILFECNTKSAISTDHFQQYCHLIEPVWNDSAIQMVYDRRNEFQLSDGFFYLLTNLKRISSPDYVPTVQDLLHSRVPTKSVEEYHVTIKNVPFRFVDVGGQRKQRAKWLHCMDNVNAILFIVSSVEYDQYLVEDPSHNRLHESLATFELVVNSFFLQQTSIIIFFNKTDLLIQKLRTIHQRLKQREMAQIDWAVPIHQHQAMATIKDFFSDFPGDPCNVGHVQSYLLSLFQSKRRDTSHHHLYAHFTTAVDTNNMKHVFHDVRNTILERNIAQIMLN